MAILIKASTARNKADKVDKRAEFLSAMADVISGVASEGEYSVRYYFPEEYNDYMRGELHTAGYEVAPYTNHPHYISCCSAPRKSPWQKLLDAISPPNHYKEDEVAYVGYEGYYDISWKKPLDSTQTTKKA